MYTWFGRDRESTTHAYYHHRPSFTFPFERRTEKWADDCACPEGCERFVRDSETLEVRGRRMAWRKTAADGMMREEGIKAVRLTRVKVTFVCALLEEEQVQYREMDCDEVEAFAVSDFEPGFTRELFETPDSKRG